jgi:GT2 family glycosyltransferase
MTSENRAVIIIPTMGSPELIVRCVSRILMNRANWNTHLIVVANPHEDAKESCAFSKFQVESEVQAAQVIEAEKANGVGPTDVTLNWISLPSPAGWVGAVNEGVKAALAEFAGYDTRYVIMNDDALVGAEWLTELSSAFDVEKILLSSSPDFINQEGVSFANEDRIGMVGPVSNNAAWMQQVGAPKITMSNGSGFTASADALLDNFSEKMRVDHAGCVMESNYLSGFLTMYSGECLKGLYNNDDGWFLDPCFGIGGHDDNDICARAEMAGWRRAIATNVYVHHIGHQTLDAYYPELGRGCANVGSYLGKWKEWTSRDQTMAACYRVRLHTMQDLLMLRNSVQRAATLFDGIAILLTDNPAKITGSDDYVSSGLQPADLALIDQSASTQSPAEVADVFLRWVNQATTEVTKREIPATVECWEGVWNERDERNKSIELAESFDPDWIISIDHDEIVEDRINRSMIQRLMKHPDPNVQVYDIGWLNHWDTPRLCRVDPPWCGPDYTASMRGFRIWRFNKISPRRIVGGNAIGLHCGNSPDFGITAKRVAGLRMRHFGYLRPVDRMRKYQFYSRLDPDPDANLTTGGVGTGGYAHLVEEEGMRLSPYVQRNGIAYFMLVYNDEQAFGVAEMLSNFYGLSDKLILVWTGEDSEPSPNVKQVGDAYGVEWIHEPFTGDLSKCRNAAMDKIRSYCSKGISWALSMDDDEVFPSAFQSAVSIRRMAEVSDGFGWMFRFKNYRHDGQWHWSETQRMLRVEPSGMLYFSGKVHETVEKANREMIANGIFPKVRYAPFSVDHFGLSGSPETMQKKLVQYTRMLVEELRDHPDEPAPWVSLGLQYGNDQMEDEMIRCFERACELSGQAYLPWKELATVTIRRGRRLFEQTLARLAPAHPYHKTASEIVKWLSMTFPDQPLSGNANKSETAVPSDISLDELLALKPVGKHETPILLEKPSNQGTISI